MEAILVSVCAILFVFLFGITLLDIALRSIQYGKILSIHRKGNANAFRLLRILAAPEASISILLFLKYSLTSSFLHITRCSSFAHELEYCLEMPACPCVSHLVYDFSRIRSQNAGGAQPGTRGICAGTAF